MPSARVVLKKIGILRHEGALLVAQHSRLCPDHTRCVYPGYYPVKKTCKLCRAFIPVPGTSGKFSTWYDIHTRTLPGLVWVGNWPTFCKRSNGLLTIAPPLNPLKMASSTDHVFWGLWVRIPPSTNYAIIPKLYLYQVRLSPCRT